MSDIDDALADLVAALENPDPNWSVTIDTDLIAEPDDEDRIHMAFVAAAFDD